MEVAFSLLGFIDTIVIPFLNGLYGAVGYLGVLIAMAIESAMVPLPSELILPYAGFLVSDHSQIEPLTRGPWNFWIAVVAATIGNTLGSLVAYAIGAYGGRPFLERYGRYLLIRPHEIELAEQFFTKHGAATVFIGRLLPIVANTTTSQKFHGWPVSGSICDGSDTRNPAYGRISSEGSGIIADSIAIAIITPR